MKMGFGVGGNLLEAAALENKDLKMFLITDISSMALLWIQQDPEGPGSSPQTGTSLSSSRTMCLKKQKKSVIGRKSMTCGGFSDDKRRLYICPG